MFPYKPAAMIPVIRPNTLPTVCHENFETPWYAIPSVNWPWKEYTNMPYIMYTVTMSNWAQH